MGNHDTAAPSSIDALIGADVRVPQSIEQPASVCATGSSPPHAEKRYLHRHPLTSSSTRACALRRSIVVGRRCERVSPFLALLVTCLSPAMQTTRENPPPIASLYRCYSRPSVSQYASDSWPHDFRVLVPTCVCLLIFARKAPWRLLLQEHRVHMGVTAKDSGGAFFMSQGCPFYSSG